MTMSVTERLHKQVLLSFGKIYKQQGRRHKISECVLVFLLSTH